jgi:hypothetical protein
MNKIITLKKECIKIKNIATDLPNNIFFTSNLINELILLNLKVEKILFDKKNKNGNPISLVLNIVKRLEQNLKDLLFLKDFANKKKYKEKKIYKREIS